MKGYKSSLETETQENTNFRRVLYSGKHLQLVLMSLKAGEEIGEETHMENDQFFRFESGTGKCYIDGNEYFVKPGDALIVPAGAKHNVVNSDQENEFKMYTIYAPPHHRDGILRQTKQDAADMPETFDGITTEDIREISGDKSEMPYDETEKSDFSMAEKETSADSMKRSKKLDKYQEKIAKLSMKIDEINDKIARLNN